MQVKMRTYAQVLYDAMLAEAVDDGNGNVIYEGFVHKLYVSLDGIVPGYYSPVINKLIELGCVERVVKGASFLPSKYVLHADPKEVDWGDAPKPSKDLTLAGAYASLDVRVKVIEGKVGSSIEPAIRQLYERLEALEQNREAESIGKETHTNDTRQ